MFATTVARPHLQEGEEALGCFIHCILSEEVDGIIKPASRRLLVCSFDDAEEQALKQSRE
jgi:hypothetical protein